jgi:UDP-glucose 4-epimerase
MRYLVTGGAGFLGSHLVRALLDKGEVVVLDDFSTGDRARLRGLPVVVVTGDVADPEFAGAAVEGVGAVFHLAANPSVVQSISDPLATGHANDLGTIAILDAARRAGVEVCVFTSSCAVYGAAVPPCQESMPLAPMSPYAASKLAGEAYLQAATRCWGLRTVSLRLFNVYGPGQRPDGAYAAVVPKFAARIAAGESITIHGDGRQTRDFVHVSDVVRALCAAAEAGVSPPHPINIGSGQPTRLLDLVEAIARIQGVVVQPEFAPPRPGEVRHSHADIAAAARYLGWRPAIPLAAGLETLV